jgi:hypothetical protein
MLFTKIFGTGSSDGMMVRGPAEGEKELKGETSSLTAARDQI